jgi:hypothetical protein
MGDFMVLIAISDLDELSGICKGEFLPEIVLLERFVYHFDHL